MQKPVAGPQLHFPAAETKVAKPTDCRAKTNERARLRPAAASWTGAKKRTKAACDNWFGLAA